MYKTKRVKKIDDSDSGVYTDGTRFRLVNVRGPEKHQFGSAKATRTLAGMLARSNGLVRVKSVGRSYNRSVDFQSNKDGSINRRMRQKDIQTKGDEINDYKIYHKSEKI